MHSSSMEIKLYSTMCRVSWGYLNREVKGIHVPGKQSDELLITLYPHAHAPREWAEETSKPTPQVKPSLHTS